MPRDQRRCSASASGCATEKLAEVVADRRPRRSQTSSRFHGGRSSDASRGAAASRMSMNRTQPHGQPCAGQQLRRACRRPRRWSSPSGLPGIWIALCAPGSVQNTRLSTGVISRISGFSRASAKSRRVGDQEAAAEVREVRAAAVVGDRQRVQPVVALRVADLGSSSERSRGTGSRAPATSRSTYRLACALVSELGVVSYSSMRRVAAGRSRGRTRAASAARCVIGE